MKKFLKEVWSAIKTHWHKMAIIATGIVCFILFIYEKNFFAATWCLFSTFLSGVVFCLMNQLEDLFDDYKERGRRISGLYRIISEKNQEIERLKEELKQHNNDQ